MYRQGKPKHKFEIGIEAARKKRLAQVHAKAKMLREYAKIAKREGIQSERVNVDRSKSSDVKQSSDTTSSPLKASSIKQKSKHVIKNKKNINNNNDKKSDLLQIYKVKQHQIQIDNELKLNQKTQKDLDIENAIKERENNRKLRYQKTKKGQPILGNQMLSMLSQIQNTIQKK